MTHTPSDIRAHSLRAAPALAVAALLAAVLFFVPSIFNDPDSYWHVTTGEWVLAHGAVPTTDPFSWSFAGRPWTAHEWLSDVLLALAYRGAGWSGVAMLTGLAAGSVAALLGLYARRALSLPVTLLFLVFVIFGMAPSLLARPHILALPALALWMIGLLDARAGGRAPSLWLLPVMLFWTNAHGSFALGLALIGPFALEALVETPQNRIKVVRDWIVFGLAAVATTLLNPQALHGLLFPFEMVRMGALSSILEWQSTKFDTFTPFQAVLFEGLFFALWLGVRVPVLRLLLLLGMLYLALAHVRQQIILMVIATLLLRDPFAQALSARGADAFELSPRANRTIAALAGAAFAAAVVFRLALPLERAEDVNAPRSAFAAVPAEIRAGRVLNGYNLGAYLIFRGTPTFVDGRTDMYGDVFLAKDAALRRASPQEVASDLDAKSIAWTFLEPSDPLARTLDHVQGWRRIYSDRFAVVHARSALMRRAEAIGGS